MIALVLTQAETGDLALQVYKCRHCPGWHIGHPQKRRQRQLRFQRLLKLIDRANRGKP